MGARTAHESVCLQNVNWVPIWQHRVLLNLSARPVQGERTNFYHSLARRLEKKQGYQSPCMQILIASLHFQLQFSNYDNYKKRNSKPVNDEKNYSFV